MPKTIMVVGAGPGIGLHVAHRFGKEGFRVALIARTKANLDTYVAKLGELGIEAVGFPADATNQASLADAIVRVQETFGPVDVFEYSPTPDPGMLVMPRNITAENTRPMLEFTLGAITAVQAVLPDMLKRGDGGLLFTSAASAIEPVPFSSNYAIGQSGIRSYVHSLHNDLRKDGIYAGMLFIAGLVNKGDGSLQPPGPIPVPPGQPAPMMPMITAYSITESFWDMYTKRDRIDEIVGDMEIINRMIAGVGGQ